MKFLVTGGAGFIGTNLVEKLLLNGHEVSIVDDLSNGKEERVPQGAVFHKIDICEREALAAVMKGSEIVVHLAALPRVQFSIEHPFEAQRVNVEGTLSVLEAARRTGVTRVVYAASSSAYGDQEEMPLKESMTAAPKSPYGLQKYYGEGLMKLWSDIHALETVSLRFFNVYGPHQDSTSAYALVIDKFLKQRSDGVPLTITGDGTQSRDFTHVQDTVDAIIRAALSEKVGKGEVFNIGAGRDMSINDIAALVGGPVEYVAPRIEPKRTLADYSYSKAVLGWEPTVAIEEGIAELKQQLEIAQ
jgi:UDP-glucose 4-epimerase